MCTYHSMELGLRIKNAFQKKHTDIESKFKTIIQDAENSLLATGN